MERRHFINNTTFSLIGLSLLGTYACKNEASTSKKSNTDYTSGSSEPFFKISLAQWSLHKMILEKKLNPMDFAQKAHDLGFDAIEYVSQLYTEEVKKRGNDDQAILSIARELKEKSDALNMRNQLMMVDIHHEKDLLASPDEQHRKNAVEKHKIWVDASAILGCESMRVSLFGSNEVASWKSSSIQSLKELCAYAADKKINIIVENHGGLSSNAALVAEVIKAVNAPNCGTVPDFGNFCLRRKNDALWGEDCIEEYNKYIGVEELMPFAKGVSSKTFIFDQDGEEVNIDFTKMLQIVKDAGYTGYIGIEYEGDGLSEEEGILASKALLLKSAKKLQTTKI